MRLNPLTKIINRQEPAQTPGFVQWALYGLLGWWVVLSTGCATDPATRIKAFSDATITMADNTTKAFNLVEEAQFQREISDAATNTFDGAKEINPNGFPAFMRPADLQVRIEVLTGLKTYAANLAILTGNSPLTNLDKETTKLGQALVALDTNLVQYGYLKTLPISNSDLRILTTVVNTAGRWYIVHRQQKDAKATIQDMQPIVDKFCELLQSDFQALETQFQLDEDARIGDANLALKASFAYYNAQPDKKLAAVQQIAELSREEQNGLQLFEAMRSAVAKLQKTHDALEQAFDQNSPKLESLIQELSSEAQRISKYYSSLKNLK